MKNQAKPELLVTLDNGTQVPLSLALELVGAAVPAEGGDQATGRTSLRLMARGDFRDRVQSTLRVEDRLEDDSQTETTRTVLL